MEKSLADIFQCPSDDEDFLGFGVDSPEGFSEESRDSLHSSTSWKSVLRFRSSFITDELAQIFMDSDSEGEFEGFSKAESSLCSAWVSPMSEEDSDDIGFYSDDDDPASQRRRSSGLCVAFRFPTRTSSAHKRHAPRRASGAAEPNGRPARKRRGGRLHPPVAFKVGRTQRITEVGRSKSKKRKESELTEAELQILNKRAKNIAENKAMLAMLFADLTCSPELSPKTTPTKRRASTNRKPRSESERRNPSRKARPPEHFGLEEEPVTASKTKKRIMEIDLKRLLKVDQSRRSEGRSGIQKRRRYRKHRSLRVPEDITEEELDNVADRTKDKILDKDNGSTCHQCRQKTLDTKTVCRSSFCRGIKGQFCGPCLRNRYGEDVRTALLDPAWECPICRGVCNCSLCRKRDGRCATGSLSRMAKYYGHDSVKEYLESLQENSE